MTDEEFAELLALGHELRGTEFKSQGPRSDRRLFIMVVRAMLGMANNRDGGRVIIGVEETDGSLNPVGLSDADLATWNYDHIADSLAPYADPSVSFYVEEKEYQRKKFVIIRVREFDEIPVLCNKDETIRGDSVLRKGACYVRSRRKPETTEIPTQEDMRDLLELGIDKGMQKRIAQMRRVGIEIPGAIAPTDEGQAEPFDRQLDDLR